MASNTVNTSSHTIADVVAASGGSFDSNGQDFDILFQAIQAAELVPALANADADLTVFAPTDKAFIRLAQDFGYAGNDESEAFDAIVSALTDLGNGDPIPVLTNVLLYHVSPGAKTLENIQSLDTIETLLEGTTFTPQLRSGEDTPKVKLVDNDPDLANPRVSPTLTDIETQNGIIQGINRVLVPLDVPTPEPSFGTEATIADIVAASGNGFDRRGNDFDILFQAVQAANLGSALADAGADLTVFAPTDRAFIRLAQDLGYEGRDESEAFDTIVAGLTDLGNGDPIPLLTDVLFYHVSPDAKTLDDIQELDTVETLLEGATFTPKSRSKGNRVKVRLVDNDPDLGNPRIRSKQTDIEAQNGIIQGINRVLLPLNIPNPGAEDRRSLTPAADDTIADVVASRGNDFDRNGRDFDILLQAVQTAGLTSALADIDADLTVFAPTDRAFVKLAQDLGYDGHDEAEAFDAIADALTGLGNGDPVPLLTDVLLYHVSPEAKTLDEIKSLDTVDTLLEGGIITPKGNRLVDNAPDLADPRFNRFLTDIQTQNGTIQAINRVLIPLDLATDGNALEAGSDLS